jgi:DNA-binding MarR family transcriptional regulator
MDAFKEVARHKVLGNPIRLGIMLYLLPREKALFANLQNVLGITPGNLDSQLRTLEREGYVRIGKIIADRPRTVVKITDKGAAETRKYLKALREFLNSYEEANG